MTKISPEQYADLERVRARIQRATKAISRATDPKVKERATATLLRARQDRDAFVLSTGIPQQFAPPPARIRYTTEAHWTFGAQSGVHRFEIEMVLDYLDIGGPQYRAVRVLSESGAPPRDARRGAEIVGVAWKYVQEHIERGVMVPI